MPTTKSTVLISALQPSTVLVHLAADASATSLAGADLPVAGNFLLVRGITNQASCSKLCMVQFLNPVGHPTAILDVYKGPGAGAIAYIVHPSVS